MRRTRNDRLLAALWIGALGAMLISTHAHAQGPFSGTEMLRNCERVLATPGVPSDANIGRQVGICWGFLAGLQNGIMIGHIVAGGTDAERLFCVPPGVTLEQHVRVALLWLRNHPERLHEDASALIAIAFIDAFPCPKPSPPKTEKK